MMRQLVTRFDLENAMRDDCPSPDSDGYRFRMLRDLLKELGCPWPDECHIPTTVAEWVNRFRSIRFDGQWPKPEELVAHLFSVAKDNDSALHEVAALTIRRLAENQSDASKLNAIWSRDKELMRRYEDGLRRIAARAENWSPEDVRANVATILDVPLGDLEPKE